MQSLRVVVVGASCSGKSSFAAALAARRNCAKIELDELHWGPDWTPRPAAEFKRLADEATASERWVVAGNYGTVRDVVWPRATTIVWLNLSFPRVFWRALRRTVVRSLTGASLFNGNRETLRRAFLSRESLLLWILASHRRRQHEFRALRASSEYGHLKWFEARSRREAKQVLERLERTG